MFCYITFSGNSEIHYLFENSLISLLFTIVYIIMGILNILHGLELLNPISESRTGNYYKEYWRHKKSKK